LRSHGGWLRCHRIDTVGRAVYAFGAKKCGLMGGLRNGLTVVGNAHLVRFKTMYSVCVFCGTSVGNHPHYAAAAREVARLLAQKGCRIIFGGGNVGLMGVVAQAALDAGGYVVGIAPKLLLEKELTHRGLSELHIVETMHERKVMMTGLADAVLALPGGYGTLDELFEVLTLQQLGVHDKPCGLLNVNGFFDQLIAYLDHATAEGFLRPNYRGMLAVADNPRALLARIGLP